MGNLEKESRKNSKRRNIQRVVLHTIAVAGVLSVGLLAPNIFVALDKLGLIPKPREGEIINTSVGRMRKRGLIKFENGRYALTPSGEKLLRKWEFSEYKLNRPKKWDKKWRMVIFDIPEKLRKVRGQIRIILSSAGFVHLQDSVWVYPYDCEDVIALLKTDYGVGKYLLYLIVEQIENDRSLREIFKLS